MAQTLRQHCDTRLKELNSEFSTWEAHYRDLCEYVSPRSARFIASDRNKGDKRNQKILNETATFCLETLQRGLLFGVTNPSRPWLRVKTPFPELNAQQDVREWLDLVGDRILEVFRRSNFYAEVPNLYEDLGLYGTGAAFVEKDADSVIRLESLPIGSYRLAMNGSRRVNCLVREFQKTRRELVDEFGKEHCTKATQDAVENNSGAETNVDVVHIIERNPDYREGSPFANRMKFRSIYYEKAANDGLFLRQSGFNSFRVLAPRWKVKGGDTYGESPTMQVLGTIKGLQKLENRTLTLLNKVVDPPLVAPTTLKNKLISQLAGSISFADSTTGQAPIQPMFQLSNVPLQEAEAKIGRYEARIRQALFTDIFLMLSGTEGRPQMTAEEIRARLSEKIQTLGPILVRLFDEVLDQLVEITFEIMQDPDFPGLIPPAPEALQNAPLNIEYVSEMAQAMKLSGVSAIENTVGFVLNVASQQVQMQQVPTALDKLNLDAAIDAYGELAGTPAKLINDKEAVGQIRQIRAQAQQQAQDQAEAAEQADMMAKLAKAPADTDSVLSRMGGAA